jgi:hypothetical protein
MLHIYTETMQPATGWIDTHSGEPMQMGYEPEKLIYTDCCGQQRPAKDCMVQCYYDGLSVWCATAKGCKDPQVIAEKKAKEFATRSAGQKARWAKAKASNATVQAAGGALSARSPGTTG